MAILLVACSTKPATDSATATATSTVEAATRPSAETPTGRPTTASRGSPALPSASSDPDWPPARKPRDGACTADGLLAKGTLRTSTIDLHSYARLLGETFRKDVVVAGDLATPKGKPPCVEQCLDFEDAITDFEQAFSLSGAPLTMRRGAALISYRTQPTATSVPGSSPAVDLSLSRVASGDVAKLLGDVSKRAVGSVPDGELSIFTRGRPALDALALVADAAGATLTNKGTALEFGGGNLPPRGGTTTELTKQAPATIERDVLAPTEDIGAMKVVALVSSPTDTVRAALRSPGSRVTWVVKVGDFIGKPRLARVDNEEVMVNARVSRIHCLGVDFEYQDKNKAWLFLK